MNLLDEKMSRRSSFRGYVGKSNEDSPKRILSSKVSTNLSIFSNPCPSLYDKNDFPSLSGNEDSKSNNPDLKLSTYSEKLKSSSQTTVLPNYSRPFYESHCKVFTNQGNKISTTNDISECKLKNSRKDVANSISKMKENNQVKTNDDLKLKKENNVKFLNDVADQPNTLRRNRFMIPKSDFQIPVKEAGSESLKEKNKCLEEKFIYSTKQNKKAFNTIPNKASVPSPNNVTHLKKRNDNPSNRAIKCDILFDKAQIKKEVPMGEEKIAKKKKRKSKIKRQTEMQTGKITLLTPEFHSKILNQATTMKSKTSQVILTDLTNEEEYPELGKSFTAPCQKENVLKKENADLPIAKEKKLTDTLLEKDQSVKEEVIKQVVTPEKKGKTIHPNDPITVTFLDMLMAKNAKTKVKEPKDESINIYPPKVKPKKGQAPNLLDASCPVVKRGKERENPKPKKPSHLKKIILLDRKARKLLRPESSSPGHEEDVLNGNASNQYSETNHVSISIDTLKENVDCDNFCNDSISKVPKSDLFQESLENENSFSDNENSIFSPCSSNENEKCDETLSILPLNSVGQSPDEINNESPSVSSEKHLNLLDSNDSLLKSLGDSNKSDEVPAKEKAAKILLHTRHFREYCNHLTSEDIDVAVQGLLDDLARFQDRLHQKDPVKARIKRRMIYGVKEVKKHIKLKKLKCIIIATDIENVETEGCLNDILNDIKSLAADHNIPCVFALGRKALGKVCRKPVPVSCIGVFNAEGSEANFKKMVELHIQSKKDYMDILKNLISVVTEEETQALNKARKEAPETLNDIRINILRQHLLVSQSSLPEPRETNFEFTDSSDSE